MLQVKSHQQFPKFNSNY